jgi:hypothetical protein
MGHVGDFNATKTHCPKGHPYDDENTSWDKSNTRIQRRCKICKRERDKSAKQKWRTDNPEESKAASKKWYNNNTEKKKAAVNRQRAAKRATNINEIMNK